MNFNEWRDAIFHAAAGNWHLYETVFNICTVMSSVAEQQVALKTLKSLYKRQQPVWRLGAMRTIFLTVQLRLGRD